MHHMILQKLIIRKCQAITHETKTKQDKLNSAEVKIVDTVAVCC